MLTFDTRDFQRYARAMDGLANQIPFAMAQALNASAEIARQHDLPRVWAEHVNARDKNFIKAALTLKGGRATKRKLSVLLRDQYGRANLKLHDEGGTRRARGKNIAIPNNDIQSRRNSKGVPKSLRPANLPSSFVTDGRRPNRHLKQNAVYVREGGYRAKGTVISRTGKKRKAVADFRTVRLMYVLKPTVPIRADVPFHQAFATSMRRNMPVQFRLALRKAMATARKMK